MEPGSECLLCSFLSDSGNHSSNKRRTAHRGGSIGPGCSKRLSLIVSLDSHNHPINSDRFHDHFMVGGKKKIQRGDLTFPRSHSTG